MEIKLFYSVAFEGVECEEFEELEELIEYLNDMSFEYYDLKVEIDGVIEFTAFNSLRMIEKIEESNYV